MKDLSNEIQLIKQTHQDCLSLGRKSLDSAIKCGEYLTLCKKEFGQHSQWLKWCQKNISEIKQRTIERRMELYRFFSNQSNGTILEECHSIRQGELKCGIRKQKLGFDLQDEEEKLEDHSGILMYIPKKDDRPTTKEKDPLKTLEKSMWVPKNIVNQFRQFNQFDVMTLQDVLEIIEPFVVFSKDCWTFLREPK
jgi:hypothetical protein